MADKSQTPIFRLWRWWFTPRSTDPTVTYRERALRFLLPIFVILRIIETIGKYFGISNLPHPYEPEWLSLIFFVIPMLFSFHFLLRQKVDWAGTFFVLHWFLTDLLSLPVEGYWYAGFQISLVIQIIFAALLLPSRGILPFLVFQLASFGIWGHWLELNYFEPPLLSSGQPVANFLRTIVTLGMQETIIIFIVRYLRLEMEKSLRVQGSIIHQLEQEINDRQQTDARLRGIFQNSPDFIMEMDRCGTILFANRRTEEYVGTQIYRYLPSDSRKQVEEIIAQAYETGSPKVFEIQLFEDDGSLQWYSIRLGPVMSAGRVDRLVVISTNIHARKEAELQIVKSAERLTILNEIGRVVSEVTDLKTVLDVIRQQLEKLVLFDFYSVRILNKEKQTITHVAVYENGRYWDESESILEPGTDVYKVFETGAPVMHLMTDEEMQQEQMYPYIRIGDCSRMTTSLIFVPLKKQSETIGVLSVQRYKVNSYTSDDLHLVEAVGIQVAIAIENAQLFESLQRELQERIVTEKIREKLIGELEHKNAELERFTYTVSHDLRSPIVTIKGFVGLLDKDMRENRPDRIQSDIQRIAGATDKMDALLKDLLELSRIGRLVNPPEEVDTVRLIQDSIENVDAQIRSNNVDVKVEPALPKLYGDRIRLREVFENLIGNAAKYMGDQTNPLIEIGFKDHGDETMFYVKDNGMGIDPRYHARIFNLFEKLNPTIEGTGIGLTLVKRIVEVHGGRIWVESEGVGKGSMFCFTLPNGKAKT